MDVDTKKMANNMTQVLFIQNLFWGFAPSIMMRSFNENLPYFILTISEFIGLMARYIIAKVFDNFELKQKIVRNYKKITIVISVLDFSALAYFLCTRNYFVLCILDMLVNALYMIQPMIRAEIDSAWFNGNDRTEYLRQRSQMESMSSSISKLFVIAFAIRIIGDNPIGLMIAIVIRAILFGVSLYGLISSYQFYEESIEKLELMWIDHYGE